MDNNRDNGDNRDNRDIEDLKIKIDTLNFKIDMIRGNYIKADFYTFILIMICNIIIYKII